MLSVPSHIKTVFSFALILFLQSDSILFSSKLTLDHYNHTNVYLYQAANFGSAQASRQLYDETQDVRWLKLAAKQGSREAAYLWYLKNKESNVVWLEYAANEGFAPAILMQLNGLIGSKKWLQAKALVEQRKEQIGTSVEELATELSEIEGIIDLALLPDEEVLVTVTEPEVKPFENINYQCRLQIQPLLAQADFKSKVTDYQQAIEESALAELPICFNPPSVVRELASICQQDGQGRIECGLKKLAALAQVHKSSDHYTHLLVIVDKGEANTRGGLMYLDRKDSDHVFLHELAHWFGLVDEYQIGKLQQKQLCTVNQHGYLGLNLFVTKKEIKQEQAEQLAGRTLYPADTCNGSDYQAYKFSAEPSFMQYLQAPISLFYQAMITENITWSNVVPAAMNFADIYKDDYDLYLSYVKQAASTGYQGAITEFSQHLVEQGSYMEAKNWLEYGAEQGAVNSQLLLGHAYLEGRWLPRDLSESALWYKKAAEQNDGFGLYFYGKCLEMGWGCIQSKEQAYQYYRRSASKGNKLAKQKLRRLTTH